MASEAITQSIDRIPDRPTKTCTRCRHPHPIDQFGPRGDDPDKLRSWCYRCQAIHNHGYRQSEKGQASGKAYRSRPEVRARRLESQRSRAEAKKAAYAIWSNTPKGRAILRRKSIRRHLKNATSDARRIHLMAMIAEYDRIILRLSDEHELRKEPPSGKPIGRPMLVRGRTGASAG